MIFLFMSYETAPVTLNQDKVAYRKDEKIVLS